MASLLLLHFGRFQGHAGCVKNQNGKQSRALKDWSSDENDYVLIANHIKPQTMLLQIID